MASHSGRDTKTFCMYSSRYDSNNFGSLAITDLKHTGGLKGQMVKNRDWLQYRETTVREKMLYAISHTGLSRWR